MYNNITNMIYPEKIKKGLIWSLIFFIMNSCNLHNVIANIILEIFQNLFESLDI